MDGRHRSVMSKEETNCDETNKTICLVKQLTRRNMSLRCLFVVPPVEQLSSLWVDSVLIGDVDAEFCLPRSFFRRKSTELFCSVALRFGFRRCFVGDDRSARSGER